MADDYFDGWIAERYRVLWPHLFAAEVVDPAVAFLADLAGTGPVLELGIGTGRLALPLSRRGISIRGIELSSAMVEQLRAQPGADEIDVTIGDFATTRVAGAFRLAYLVRNTIMNLTTQDAQVECFRNVAAHLDPGGRFVLEVVVPPWQRLQPGETIVPFHVSPDHLGFDEIDVATQKFVVAPLLVPRRRDEMLLGAFPIRLALRARPHGATRRDAAAGTLEQLGPRPVHEQ